MNNIGIGTKLYGFCNGFFGRDSYDTKTIEAIGSDWVVARDSDGIPTFAFFNGDWYLEKDNLLKEWANED